MSVLVRARKKQRLFGKHSTPSFLKQPKKEKKSVILNSKNARNHSITLKVVCPWAFCIYKFLNIPATCGEF